MLVSTLRGHGEEAGITKLVTTLGFLFLVIVIIVLTSRKKE